MRGRSVTIAAVTAGAVFVVLYVMPRPALAAYPRLTHEPAAVPLGSGIRVQNGARSVVMWPAGEDGGMCRVIVRVTNARSLRSPVTRPGPSYRFVFRPTRKNLAFTWFALPDRDIEQASTRVRGSSEGFEIFQVFYREVLVGPTFASSDPADSTLRSVDCDDVDVVVMP